MLGLKKILPANYYRRWLISRVSGKAIQHYLETELPSKQSKVNKLEFVVLDFETTGLDVERDTILSVGFTVIKQRKVALSENYYAVVKQQTDLTAESVAIHQITDTDAEKGIGLKQVLDKILENLAGRVLVAHHAEIERGFLNKACRQVYGYDLPMIVLDTLRLEKKRLERRHAGYKANQLRLFNIRDAYGLPRYRAHNALEDAVATAELLLVQMAYVGGSDGGRLREYL